MKQSKLMSTISGQSVLTKSTFVSAFAGAIALASASSAIQSVADYSGAYSFGAFIPYAGALGLIAFRIRDHHPDRHFGAANTVTLVRLVLACLLAGLVLELLSSNGSLDDTFAWLFVFVTACGLGLDGLDGYLARRLKLESDFGARFDMEVDAFLILCLAGLVVLLNKAGSWVLVGGVLRYAFLGAAWIWPALNAPLPPSWRRKCAAVVQAGVLSALLVPGIVPPWSVLAAAGALAFLLYSFSVDIVFLLQRAPHSRQSAP